MYQSSKCWNCHNENNALKEGNDFYVNYFQEEEEEKEEPFDKGNIKNYIDPLKNLKNLKSNSEFDLEDLNKDFLNSDKNNNINNLKNKKK